MTTSDRLVAIYDFEFFPYALGDVLTWNIRTAMRCEELGKKWVDVYLCLDERYPASIYQRGLVNPDNFDLFFSELYGAFGTNPKLGNIFIFRQREAMLAQLQQIAKKDDDNLKSFEDYLGVMKYSADNNFVGRILSFMAAKTRVKAVMKKILNRLKRMLSPKVSEALLGNLSHEYVLNKYFIKYVYSHEAINKFYEEKKRLPFLTSSLGCTPDVDEMIASKFKGKKIVPFHIRLRRLDLGYGGDHSYARDSNFLEWYTFLKEASQKHPEVQFIALGRLQEKPLEILRLPNVTSLRLYGMGLGHELTLMLKSHLFIGSSSGFATLANFSALPYFITRMNPGSCDAYAIPQGAEKLPFASENQKLVYEKEDSVLLMKLLEQGLRLSEQTAQAVPDTSTGVPHAVDVGSWFEQHSSPHHRARTTYRFYHDDKYRHEETAYLLLPYLEEARKAFIESRFDEAQASLCLVSRHFPELCEQFPEYLLLSAGLATSVGDLSLSRGFLDKLKTRSLPDNLKKISSLFTTDFDSAETQTSLMDQLKQSLEKMNFAEVA